nr:bifunctional metallophosphatase/5'-nucleotidase [Deltaproteobacteria bacterium]
MTAALPWASQRSARPSIVPFVPDDAIRPAAAPPPAALVRLAPRLPPRVAAPAPRVVISLVGTNDLHGRIALLPWLGGHLANLRSARRADGAVLLVDAGDLFQGTLASNLTEGAAVVRAYNALGYAAAAIGNHEFDYGPSGEATFPRAPSDDPRGALRARAREASFPFLAANIVEASSGNSLPWDNVSPDLLTTIAGVRVGLVGVSTEATPTTTLAVNFRGLAMRPLADTVSARAASLRARGAAVVVVLAHAGGGCRRFDQPDDLSTCDAREEVFELARALPEGGVDAIVAGHTHRGVAHVVHGIPVIESFANGEAFGRVDLTVERGRVTGRQVFPPRGVCGEISREPADPSRCAPAPYEGAPVVADEAVARIVAGPLADARAVEERSLGVVVERGMRSRYQEESALTNLVADRMLAAAPGADVALMNSGGVRADLPEGALDYGELYSVLPFDNRLVTVRMRGSALRAVLRNNARADDGALGLAGARVAVTCAGSSMELRVTRDDGRAVGDDEVLTVATNDYLAGGSLSRHLAEPLTDDAIAAAPVMRDAVAAGLAAVGPLRGDDPRWYDPARPRVALPHARPVRCR